MKKILCVALLVVAGCFAFQLLAGGGGGGAPVKYEYAVVKWDGPDRLYYNLPDKFEMVHLETIGTKIPRDAQAEEFCLTVGANVMAKDGWEPVNLDSRRILFRRAK